MKHYIKETQKGYLITVYDKSKKIKYFFRDESHTYESVIFDMISNNNFAIGKPFGSDIYPIYKKIPMPFVKREELPKHNHKTLAIWKYYRNLVVKNDQPRYIKQYAKEMKTNLLTLGIDTLYTYVQAQEEFAI